MCWAGMLSACYRYSEPYISWFECQAECDRHVWELEMNSKLDADLPTTHGCQSGAIGFVVGAEVRRVEGMHEL